MKITNNRGLRLEPKILQRLILTPRLRRTIKEEEIKAKIVLPKKSS